MGLFLFRFWPVLIPLIIYALWVFTALRKAKKNGQTPPRFRDGPWYWAILASLVIAIGCFLFLGASIEGRKGTYTPPHLENGQVVPSKVTQ